MRRLCIVVIVLAGWICGEAASALAQTARLERGGEAADEQEPEEERELETDRDAFTPATSTTGSKRTIVESSYSFIDNRRVAETHSFPELLVRYGITERIELRVGWNFEVGGSGDVVSGNEGTEGFEGGKIERESQVLYGLKAALTEQSGWKPRSVAILQGYTPTSGEAPATDVVAAYAFGWELANRWRLDSSMRYGTEHGPHDAFNQWAPSVVLRVPVNERWNVHAEYFGIFSQGSEHDFSRSFISPGTHYLLTPNLELGLRLGWGITEDSPRFFSNVGIGWRF
jgi:hypothetical protein